MWAILSGADVPDRVRIDLSLTFMWARLPDNACPPSRRPPTGLQSEPRPCPDRKSAERNRPGASSSPCPSQPEAPNLLLASTASSPTTKWTLQSPPTREGVSQFSLPTRPYMQHSGRFNNKPTRMGPTKSGPAPSAAPVAVTSRAPARQCFPQQLQQSFRSEASSRPDSFVHGWLTIKHCRCQTGSQNQRSSVNDNIDTGNVNKAFRRASSIMGRPNVLRATGTTDFVFVM